VYYGVVFEVKKDIRLRMSRPEDIPAASVQGDSPPSDFGEALYGSPLIGNSPAIVKVRGQIKRIALTDAPVLVVGETGTGKSAVAEMIHRLSKPSRAPFVVVAVGALPRELVLDELFGHAKGAFSGATMDRAGVIQRLNTVVSSLMD
jgi:DNA-binding NtrC family response regulator